MAVHPLHDLFRLVDTEMAADGTVSQRELHCLYCPKAWQLHKHSAGKRQRKWRLVNFYILRNHVQQKCNHGSEDLRSVAATPNKDEAQARVAEIRAQNRPWPPLAPNQLAAPDQAASAAAASQSPIPQHSRMPCAVSMLQPEQRVGLPGGDMPASPSKRRRTMDDNICTSGASSIMKRGCKWVYLVDENARIVANWDATDVGAWRKHMPWGESDSERFNNLLSKLVCTAGCAVRIVASGAVLAQMVHPHCMLRSAAPFSRRIIHSGLAEQAQEWTRQH